MVEGLSYIHRFEKGANPDARPLLLLHGTGGNENDLVPLGRMIAPTSPLLSPRGKVLENGMPRFFRRLAEGVFDEDDVRRRAQELGDFVDEPRAHYDISLPIAFGLFGTSPSFSTTNRERFCIGADNGHGDLPQGGKGASAVPTT
jgi:phospholipase/carboxylesterase